MGAGKCYSEGKLCAVLNLAASVTPVVYMYFVCELQSYHGREARNAPLNTSGRD